MKKLILLLIFCTFLDFISAQDAKTYIIHMKNVKSGESAPGDTIDAGESIPGKIVDESKTVTVLTYQKQSLSAGEYLRQAGNCYLEGVGLSIIGSGISIYQSIKSNPDQKIIFAGGIIAAGGLIFTIVGHVKLVNAGIALDEERKVSLHPSSSGIGLALKF